MSYQEPATNTAIAAPSHSAEAERGVLGALLRDPDKIGAVSGLLAQESFFLDAHQKVYGAILGTFLQQVPVDTITLFAALKTARHLEDIGGPSYVAELWDSAPTSANLNHHVRIVLDYWRNRKTIFETERFSQAVVSGGNIDELLQEHRQRLEEIQNLGNGENRNAGKLLEWRPAPISSAEFAYGDYRHQWLIELVAVMDEPMMIFGPSKSLKTTLIVYMMICIASGSIFFGRFAVPKRRRVLIFTGESGRRSLQCLAKRVCAHLGFNLEDIGDSLQWEFSVPPGTDSGTLKKLAGVIADRKPEVVVIEPAYLSVLSGTDANSAPNAMAMGPILSMLYTTCSANGSFLILGHHTNSSIKVGDLPSLEHLMYGGFKQYARQWFGLNRREDYRSDGRHKLVGVLGGSAGHQGEYHIDINLGVMQADFSGLTFEPSILSAAETWQADPASSADDKEDAKSERQRAKCAKHDAKLLAKIDEVVSSGQPAATKTQLKEVLHSTDLKDSLERCLLAGLIEPCQFTKFKNNNGTISADGFRRPTKQSELDFDEQPGHPGNNTREESSSRVSRDVVAGGGGTAGKKPPT